MKKNVFCSKKCFVAIFILSALLIPLVVACGNGGPQGGGGAAIRAPETEEDKVARYDPPITLTHVRGISSAHNVFPEGDDLTSNAFTRLIYQELGIIIEYLWYVDNLQFATRSATMMASGEFPDFWHVDNRDFLNLARNDAVMDITELYEMWAIEELKYIDSTFPEGFQAGFVNGRHYGIAVLGHGIIAVPEIVWLRSDWLEATGLPVPTTTDELTALALAFMDLHTGAYGFALDGSMPGGVMGLTSIANAFGAYPRTWFYRDGEIIYGSIQPEMRDALLYLQNWFAEGIIHPEFSAMDGGRVMEDITSGRVGIMSGACWAGWWPLLDSVTADNADWLPIAIPTPDGERSNLQVGWPIWEYIVINRDCEHPEAVIKMLNYFIQAENLHGFQHDVVPEFAGLALQAFPVIQNRPNRTYEQLLYVHPALISGDPSGVPDLLMTYWEHAMQWKRDGDPVGYGQYVMYGALEIIRHYIYADNIIMEAIRGANPDFYESMHSSLRQLEDETFLRIIMGAPISEFDDFVEAWLDMGGRQAAEEINEEFN